MYSDITASIVKLVETLASNKSITVKICIEDKNTEGTTVLYDGSEENRIGSKDAGIDGSGANPGVIEITDNLVASLDLKHSFHKFEGDLLGSIEQVFIDYEKDNLKNGQSTLVPTELKKEYINVVSDIISNCKPQFNCSGEPMFYGAWFNELERNVLTSVVKNESLAFIDCMGYQKPYRLRDEMLKAVLKAFSLSA